MKTSIIIFSALISISAVAYATSGDKNCDGHGSAKFVQALNLDAERAAQVQEVLSSYREIGTLYKNDQQDQIPEFLAQKEAELSALLSPEEMATFKQGMAQWAEKKDFSKFMKFSHGMHDKPE